MTTKTPVLPLETSLGNVAHHVLVITLLSPSVDKPDRCKLSPLVGMPAVEVVATRMGNGHVTYTVNGVQTGNLHGAVAAFSVLCTPFLAAEYSPAGEMLAERSRGDYYGDLRVKLYNTVASEAPTVVGVKVE